MVHKMQTVKLSAERILKIILFFLCTIPTIITAQQNTFIFPIPQSMQVTNDAFIVDENLSILVPDKKSEKDLFLARFLVRELSDKYGIAVKIEFSKSIPANKKVIIIGSLNNALIKQYGIENRLALTEKNPGREGYFLQVKNNTIVIAASDDRGAFFGLQSLRQLIYASNGKKIQGLNVKDWPNMEFRAVRLFVPGPENIAFFKRFMRDFMAMYKYNKVIIEVNAMRLDKHPEVNAGWIEFAKYMQYTRSNEAEGIKGEMKNSTHYDAGDGYIIEKNTLKEIIDYAKENFIEVIPEIPSLTHGYYLLTRHPELAEYPGDSWPDTYCPSNPDTYKLMFDVLDEYIDVIKPKIIHIGHDEWWGAPIGVCPRCKDKDRSVLYAADVNKIYKYLAGKGIKTAMWGDFLLESVWGKDGKGGPISRTSSTGVEYKTPGGLPAELVKKSIPKDILVFNWFWSDPKKEMELNKLGFKQVYGNFEPNITDWDKRVKKINVTGGAASSWVATNEHNFGKDLMADFLGSANLLWSSHTLTEQQVIANLQQLLPLVRSALNYKRIPSEDGNIVEPVDITAQLNLLTRSQVFGMTLPVIRSGNVTSRSKVVNINDPLTFGGKQLIVAGTVGTGENIFANQVNAIKIDEDVSSLIFLHAAALKAENPRGYFNVPNPYDSPDLLGWYEIIYEDGFKSIVPIRYGVNILECGVTDKNKKPVALQNNAMAYCYNANPVNCSLNPADTILFYAFEWVNPRFGKKIKEVNLQGSINYQSQQSRFGKSVTTKPMAANAIILAGISKVVKRKAFIPKDK
jgi:Glycosyl hydrolase family 20, domain 2/Glycosyl hydrolase family 20, catalytic domain